jgi:hypothetical protein
MVTLDNYMNYRCEVRFNGVSVNVFVFTGQSLTAARSLVNQATSLLAGMPALHLAAVRPFLFTPGRLASTGGGGGTALNPEAAVRNKREELGADPAIVPEIIRQFGSGAARARPVFHWISQELLRQPDRFPKTVFHEATHGVDISYHLSVRNRVSPADAARLGIDARNGGGGFHENDLPGLPSLDACGNGPQWERTFTAYRHLCSGLDLLNNEEDRRKIARNFRFSAAFQSVPESWWILLRRYLAD